MAALFLCLSPSLCTIIPKLGAFNLVQCVYLLNCVSSSIRSNILMVNKPKKTGARVSKHKPSHLQTAKRTKKVIKPEQRKVILFNKPFDVLCQFTDDQNRKTLADYIPIKDVYAAGRLDRDSEGLLLLTNCGKLQHSLTDPKTKTNKTYWVQVEGIPCEKKLRELSNGVKLKDGMTLPAKVKAISEPVLWSRSPPIRKRAHIPTSWLSITINEGRNRQIRRMTAYIGHPTLRLIRHSIGKFHLDDIKNGEYTVISSEQL
jgi:23S rRNA pseudouridine2457 synthase